jgi:glutamate formiminotransferase
VHNRQVHAINEDESNEVAVAEEQRAEAQMRQSMKGAEAERMKAVDVTKTVPLCADVTSRTVMIGAEVSTEDEGRLLQFLRNNQDVCAWSKSDLTGVHHSVIEHALNTDPRVKPKLQR